jgi:tetratricopeptide (TPR) repeat protein
MVNALIASLFLATVEPGPAGVTEYRGLVALARQQGPQAAIAGLLNLSTQQTADDAEALATEPTCAHRCLQAAILLHTEARLVSRYGAKRDAESTHVRAAEILVEALRTRSDVGGWDDFRDFERRWRIAIAHGFREWVGDHAAVAVYEDVLRRFPADPEALIGLGAVFEQTASAPAFAGTPALFDGTWRNAARCYEQALTAEPRRVDARLRLGHVEVKQGRFEAARRRLQPLVSADSAASPVVQAFAHLFLGEIESHQSRPDKAIEEYRAALAAEPRLQTASLALANALLHAGRIPEAAAVQLEALRGARGKAVIGWEAYHTNLLHGYRAWMDALWAGATR